jgi:L-fuculose-phosphate aldolase
MGEIPWTERTLRKLIVKTCAALDRKGLVAATDGNVSARLGPDRILVTPSGTSKGDVRELDILLCDADGRKVRGRGEVSSEVHVHLAAYRARETICGVVHAHPIVATAFTYSGQEKWLQEPLVPEVVAQIGPIYTCPYLLPGSRVLAETVGKYFQNSDIVMLARHGAVTVGADPWAAYLRLEKLEQFATLIKTARELASDDTKVQRFSEEQCSDLRASYGKGRRSTIDSADRLMNKNSDGVDTELIAQITSRVLKKLAQSG